MIPKEIKFDYAAACKLVDILVKQENQDLEIVVCPKHWMDLCKDVDTSNHLAYENTRLFSYPVVFDATAEGTYVDFY